MEIIKEWNECQHLRIIQIDSPTEFQIQWYSFLAERWDIVCTCTESFNAELLFNLIINHDPHVWLIKPPDIPYQTSLDFDDGDNYEDN